MSIQDKHETSRNVGIPNAEDSPQLYEGQFVSVTGNGLLMTSEAGREYAYTLAQDAQVSCDGTACKPEDLKVKSKIRVTTLKKDRNMVTCIEALNRNPEFSQCAH